MDDSNTNKNNNIIKEKERERERERITITAMKTLRPTNQMEIKFFFFTSHSRDETKDICYNKKKGK